MKKHYIALINVHGLIRGNHLELGRNADTDSQILQVVELAKALGKRPEVGRVDLLTRRIVDKEVDDLYGQPREQVSDKVWIVRIEAGPESYLPKEQLWNHLDAFADNVIHYWQNDHLEPTVIHSHYADSGYVGVKVASLTGKPLLHTSYSFGRDKRKRLLATGLRRREMEDRFNIARRIEAEEKILGAADLVIASTHNEIETQYNQYDHFHPELMRVNPPGLDFDRFHPPTLYDDDPPVIDEINGFLKHPGKPIILAVSRFDERKNLPALLDAFGQSEPLRRMANLVIVSNRRETIETMAPTPQQTLTTILHKVDRYSLYGQVAFPKNTQPDEIPGIYRYVAKTRGVFANPALVEPFGLTLLEAAASGLPLVATQYGGPQDILRHGDNGFLIDPLNPTAIAEALIRLLSSNALWKKKSQNGLSNIRRRYTWESHVDRYLEQVDALKQQVTPPPKRAPHRRTMLHHDRAIFSDIDQTLLGDPQALTLLNEVISQNRRFSTFGIATGRSLESALSIIRKHGIPMPDVLITSLGTDIFYTPELVADVIWRRHIDHLWTPKEIRRILADLPGLILQPESEQGRFKISYWVDPKTAPPLSEIESLLHKNDQTVNTLFSFGQFLDIVPIRASKGQALRFFANEWDIPLQNVLAAGGSGADEDMMTGNTMGVVVGNRFEEELSQLVDRDRIFFTQKRFAAGILEAIDHFDFLTRVEPDKKSTPVRSQLLVGTDLDRTLLPNGPLPESAGARPLFAEMIKALPITLAYVSGRNKSLVLDAIQEFKIPEPNYAITDVGSVIWTIKNGAWRILGPWEEHITPIWKGIGWLEIADLLGQIEGMTIQDSENMNRFKLSYHGDISLNEKAILSHVERRLKEADVNSHLVWSVDETKGEAFLDILPAGVSKRGAFEFLIDHLGLDIHQVLFSGDSGNDLDLLISPIPSVLVANAIDDVRHLATTACKEKGWENRLYLPEGKYGMNGNYAAGIVEALAHYQPTVRAWLASKK